MRGPAAIAATAGAFAASYLLVTVISYAAQSRAPGGPATVASWGAAAIGAPGPLAGEGEKLFNRYGCRACHTLEGTGGHVGPVLDGVRLRKNRAEIVRWLDDPQKIKPGTKMPTFQFTPAEEQMLADFLLSR